MENLLRKKFLQVFLIVMVGLLAYSNTFNSSFHFDDEPNIVNNPDIKAFPGILNTKDIFTGNRFIGFLTFSINYRLHGLNVTGYHIFNLTVHIVNSLLVYWLVLLTFRTPFLKTNGTGLETHNNTGNLIALFSSLLFVSHPIQTQAVTYIVQRFTSLATMFYLLSLVMYIRWRITSKGTESREQRAEGKEQKTENRELKLQALRSMLYAISIISAVLAMKTKEIAFTLPVIIAIYEFMFFKERIKKKVLYLIPFFVVMLIILFNLLYSDQPIEKFIADLDERTRSETDMSRADYLFTQFRVIVTYIRLIFLPINQNFDYDYPVYHSFFNTEVLLSLLFLLSILGLGIYLLYYSKYYKFISKSSHPVIPACRESFLKNDPGQAGMTNQITSCLPANIFFSYRSLFTIHHYRLISFGIMWFFITLSVESSIIPIVDVINEHRVYLPSAGIFIAISASAFAVCSILKNKLSPAFEKTFMLFPGLVIIILTSAAYARNMVWKDEVSLWSNVVMNNPNKARGFYNLGSAYHDEKQFDKAIENYTKAISIKPNHVKAYTNRGNAYDEKGQTYKAIEDYMKALAINPYHADTYFNLGVACVRRGLLDNAMANFKKACAMGSEKGCMAIKDTPIRR